MLLNKIRAVKNVIKMKKYIIFTFSALLGIYSNVSASNPLPEESSETAKSSFKNPSPKDSDKQQTTCRSNYVPRERVFIGYDKSREMPKFREKEPSDKTIVQRFWHMVNLYTNPDQDK